MTDRLDVYYETRFSEFRVLSKTDDLYKRGVFFLRPKIEKPSRVGACRPFRVYKTVAALLTSIVEDSMDARSRSTRGSFVAWIRRRRNWRAGAYRACGRPPFVGATVALFTIYYCPVLVTPRNTGRAIGCSLSQPARGVENILLLSSRDAFPKY